MKRVSALVLGFILAAALAVPVLAADLAGGYYLTGDSALGSDLTFYVPAEYASGALTYNSSGYLFNLSNSSIYLYCPDYPDYTIYAPRFSVFQYRTSSGTGYTYVDLNLTDVTAANVEILTESPSLALSSEKILVMILAVVIVGVGAFVLLRR